MQGEIELRNVTKTYGTTTALDGVSVRLGAGRVHALMGKNGSGKSTLVKLLAGAIQPSHGELWVHGARAQFQTPRDSFAAGIMTVYQELSLVGQLSVGENIYLGRLPHRRALGGSVIDWPKVHRDATRLLDEMGLAISSRASAATLSIGQQQMVEIVKAMSFEPSILLLDEPTSALAAAEVAQLFALVRRLRSRGVTIVYITHRMNELFEIADTCTVVRDGRLIGTVEMGDATSDSIVEMMFGAVARAVRQARRDIPRERPVLSVRNLTRAPAFRDVSFDLYAGEVLGMAGLMGAGRTDVLRALFGADRFDSGEIILDGAPVARATPEQMKRRGLGYTPENRKEVGLVQVLSSHDNLCLASLQRIARAGFIHRRRELPYVAQQIKDLHIRVPDPMLPVSSLSGGNQQKIVIGNWLNTSPKVMFFDEPTRGIDVQAKQQVFEIIWEQSGRGLASIFVSSELEEILEVADRILVMYHGRVAAEIPAASTTLTELYRLCMGGAA